MERAAGRRAEERPPSGGRWEYTQLTIPLNLKVESGHYPTPEQLTTIEGLEGIILGHLDIAARDGWEAAEPTDWEALAAAKRFEIETYPGPDAAGIGPAIYKSVTIRLKRPTGAGSA